MAGVEAGDGVSSFFGAGAGRARSEESARTKAAEAIMGSRISSRPRRFRILVFRRKAWSEAEMQGAGRRRWSASIVAYALLCAVMSRPSVKKIGAIATVFSTRGSA